MHSFLVVGSNQTEVGRVIDQKVREIGFAKLDCELAKIEDARELSKIISLKTEGVFVIRDIDKATLPALNAFLKSLEEPSEDVYFILTARNLQRVLPTIVSRSEVIYTKNPKVSMGNAKEVISFLKSKDSEKIKFIWNLKDREEALRFISELVEFTHNNLGRSKDLVYATIILEEAEIARKSIESYGNYKLHLLKFVISISQTHA